jgi:hypothetical protein
MRLRCFALSLLLFFALKDTVAAAGVSAREALEVAKAKAVAWQGDAVVTSLGADVDKSGRMSYANSPVGWHFSFWSQKANAQLNVNIGASKQVLKTEEPKLHGVLRPFAEDFVDSDKAVAAALAHGLPEGLVLNATLAKNCPPASKETLCWEVGSLTRKGMTINIIGAKSGEFIGSK